MTRPLQPRETLLITQGEFATAERPRTMISTVLGSCISVCLWDPVAAVGGMNHILVARSAGKNTIQDAGGINAMELLINALLKMGCSRTRLVAKVFGGAALVPGLTNVGALNASFIRDFLAQESIPCLGESLGGTHARQLRFFPVEGRVMLKMVKDAKLVAEEQRPVETPAANDVELF